MKWKFWQKDVDAGQAPNEIKLKKPGELPQGVGMYMVTKLQLDPDWVWSLRGALRPHSDDKNTVDIRIFSPIEAAGKGASIANYNSLDAYPGLVLYSGWLNKVTGKLSIEKHDTIEKPAA